MSMPRSGHASITLQDGRVLIAGGQNGSSVLQTMEIFSPVTGQFTVAAPMSNMRQNHAVTTSGSSGSATYYIDWIPGASATGTIAHQTTESGITGASTQTATFDTTGQTVTGTWTAVACDITGTCTGGHNLGSTTFTLNAALASTLRLLLPPP